jgi:hypothetical protein
MGLTQNIGDIEENSATWDTCLYPDLKNIFELKETFQYGLRVSCIAHLFCIKWEKKHGGIIETKKVIN